jgi:hypothetical protein
MLHSIIPLRHSPPGIKGYGSIWHSAANHSFTVDQYHCLSHTGCSASLYYAASLLDGDYQSLHIVYHSLASETAGAQIVSLRHVSEDGFEDLGTSYCIVCESESERERERVRVSESESVNVLVAHHCTYL